MTFIYTLNHIENWLGCFYVNLKQQGFVDEVVQELDDFHQEY
jgi:hypothetical protein